MYVVGRGGHSKVVADIITATGLSVDGYYDDVRTDVVGKVSDVPYNVKCVCAIGDNKSRLWLVSQLRCEWVTVIHPSAIVSPSAKIGRGCVIGAQAVIQADVVIGDHCIINTGAIVEHDCSIGNFSHIAPGCTLCGNVSVGEGVFFGANSTSIPKIRIGKWSIVGAGATVVRNVEDNVVVVGTPAKQLAPR